MKDVSFDPGRKYTRAVALGHDGRRLQSEEDRPRAHQHQRHLRSQVQGPGDDADRDAGHAGPGDAGRWARIPTKVTKADVEAAAREDQEGQDERPDPQVHRQRLRRGPGVAGNIAIAFAWSGDIQGLAADNPDLRWIAPKEGAMLYSDNMLIPKTSDRQDEAMAWINYVYDPKHSAQIVAGAPYLSARQGHGRRARQDRPGPRQEPAGQPARRSARTAPRVPRAERRGGHRVQPHLPGRDRRIGGTWQARHPEERGGAASPRTCWWRPGVLWLIVFFVVPTITLAQTSLSGADGGWVAYRQGAHQLRRRTSSARSATRWRPRCWRWRWAIRWPTSSPSGPASSRTCCSASSCCRSSPPSWCAPSPGRRSSTTAVPPSGCSSSLHLLGEGGRLLDTTIAVIGGLTYNFLPFMILPIYVSLEKIDRRLVEAARGPLLDAGGRLPQGGAAALAAGRVRRQPAHLHPRHGRLHQRAAARAAPTSR